ncbi:urease accessory protein UreD [Prosthecobacter dejongeii]|uniref:Urease accessory protein UreD n=1 Tax=Prosthecobacter dejongeii TaxID=48465 RepID=A0A7W8DRK1_9BACT|nr:urease accessory protein UreD [Prosthecobacter dejongeii]MBB5038961.1 urease accessory protein [Prosthecobacter dejongeii]
MRGHLHLTASCYPAGQTYLRDQSFRAPLHLSKPHEDAGALVVNIVNPTAGIFDGDAIEINVAAETGASIVLTTPSASRVYRSRSGGPAKVHQTFTVEAGAFLEFYPEPFIPQAGARYQQKTELRVAAEGQLLYFDWLSPGRVASGEVFQYAELLWDLDVWMGDKLAARERYRLSPEDHSLHSLRLMHPQAHYLSCFVLGGGDLPVAELEALNSPEVYLGHGPLSTGGFTVKVVCHDSLSARRTLQELRKILYKSLSRQVPSLGRYM